jgi:hypothetical protein
VSGWAVVSTVMNVGEFHKRNRGIYMLTARVLDSEEGSCFSWSIHMRRKINKRIFFYLFVFDMIIVA